jgi:PAS domain S-box-containing protein
MNEAIYPFYEIVAFPTILLETPGFQDSLDHLVELCRVPRFLAGSGLAMTPEAEKKLSLKLVAHLLDQMTTERVDAPYISVWERGRHQEVKMLYVNPAIEKITGFSAQQVLKVGFSIFVPDDMITKIDQKDGAMEKVGVPIERARQERQRGEIAGRWERVYEILKKEGTAFVRDVAVIEEIGNLRISTGTLTDATLEFKPDGP